jgi:diacylglycerol kinase (ATP)
MKLRDSFKWALNGIMFTLRTERNFRIHIIVMGYVMFFASFYDFSKTEYIFLLLLFAGVTTAEMVNTAVERVVNLVVEKYDVQAKIAKDVAAGGVLIMAVCSVVAGGLLFWDADTIRKMLNIMLERPLIYGAILLCSGGLSYRFIKGVQK